MNRPSATEILAFFATVSAAVSAAGGGRTASLQLAGAGVLWVVAAARSAGPRAVPVERRHEAPRRSSRRWAVAWILGALLFAWMFALGAAVLVARAMPADGVPARFRR